MVPYLQGFLTLAAQNLTPFQQFLAGVVISIVAAKIFQTIGIRVLRRLARAWKSELDDIVFEETGTPIYVTIALGGIYASTFPLEIASAWYFYFRGIVFSVIAVLWMRSIIRMGKRFFKSVKKSDRIDTTFIPIFENVWSFLVIIAGLFLLLELWNINITPFLASAGVAGIAVGFAAKDAIANFFGGIALYFDDTYKVGDYIVISSGEAGTVEDVGIRSTTLRTRDDVIVTVPNSVLNSERVTNESNPPDRKRIKVPIGVAYGTDIERLEEILEDIAADEPLVLDEPEPQTRFREFGDSALNYDLLAWISNPVDTPKAVDRLNRAIYKKLMDEDIEIPFPQRTVHLDE